MSSTNDSLPVVVLISGNGSNLQVLIDRADELGIDIRAVVSNREGAFGLERARQAGIAAEVLLPRDYGSRDDYDAALAEHIRAYSPGLVVLAGFMRILSPAFVQAFAGRMLNIHPSLLPKYRGLNPHARVLENGDTEHGASVHFVTEELDGGPVLIQQKIAVSSSDDEQSLARRVQVLEHEIYPRAVALFASGRVKMRDQAIELDGKPLAAPLD
ncbi:MAG: phosphoribosylglycinamide formyltransferase [Gammaproteobacteria bacterium]|nr:phosphoribosylglycinamide formyltransferase [Gammaproteobacteria bacterium]